MKDRLELWYLGEDYPWVAAPERLAFVKDREEAVRVAGRHAAGRYMLCNDGGNLCEIEV